MLTSTIQTQFTDAGPVNPSSSSYPKFGRQCVLKVHRDPKQISRERQQINNEFLISCENSDRDVDSAADDDAARPARGAGCGMRDVG